MPPDVRTLSPAQLLTLLALMAGDTAAPLTQTQRTALWQRLHKTQPRWVPTVDDCGVEPSVLQQWFTRCNKDLRIYVTTPVDEEPDAAQPPSKEQRQV